MHGLDAHARPPIVATVAALRKLCLILGMTHAVLALTCLLRLYTLWHQRSAFRVLQCRALPDTKQ